jgi:hypothetical protein
LAQRDGAAKEVHMVYMNRPHSWLGIPLGFICLLCLASAALAEVVIIGEAVEPDTRSGFRVPPGSGYLMGQRLPDNSTLDIPECVTLIVDAAGKFLELRGPFRGTVSTYHDVGIECDSRREAPDERGEVYSRYFRQICEKLTSCDATCKAVFPLLPDKSGLKLKC